MPVGRATREVVTNESVGYAFRIVCISVELKILTHAWVGLKINVLDLVQSKMSSGVHVRGSYLIVRSRFTGCLLYFG